MTQTIPAGNIGSPVEPGTAARIFTGAPVPEGADTVVMQEHCRAEGDRLFLDGEVTIGSHIRRAGEDIAVGDVILKAGCKLGPAQIGLAASIGVVELELRRRVRVALFSTGNELVEPGTEPVAGQIYNSNRYTLVPLLRLLGCEVIDLGIIPDRLDATLDALREAAENADLILTSGGVSVGDEDYVRAAISELGRLDLWRLALKPGKPLAFGAVGDTPFIGLPGNPVSVFVTFCVIARDFIAKLQGRSEVTPQSFAVAAGFERLKPGYRREYLRGRIKTGVDGAQSIDIFSHQGSGVLNSVAQADGLAVVLENTIVNKGDDITFLPFTALFS